MKFLNSKLRFRLGNAKSALQRWFPYLQGFCWTMYENLTLQKPPNCHPPTRSFAPGWVSSALTALSQCQTWGSHNFPAQSTCPVVLLLLCCIPIFLTFFSPLWCCWWPCWTSVLICILCYPEISCTGSIWLFPCCMGHSFRGLTLFHSASFWHKTCKSHLTNLSWADPDHPSLTTPETQVIPAVSTCLELPALWTWAFVRFALFPFSLLCQSYPLEKELQVARRSAQLREVKCVMEMGFLNIHRQYSW